MILWNALFMLSSFAKLRSGEISALNRISGNEVIEIVVVVTNASCLARLEQN